ncbi:diphosphate--fructose-6-phosphate 1-phosphotransferase [Fervidibacter sacchari]|uniref:Pyrophosphate--fructose 6-phosphate 1-phosphotransferase n=1 Tax=Candidatus Fervidibacter sacchari TaxID=1448929 RepID=A0ABT2EJV5_9BACT|nr:diphosphate--fructose-6-phosphate 1-phosphotransferase [Candidatus Fervidibacter sacchari]MCS3918228.1 6-phosphofructokinase 1 [Candidatus Fervidibacter sacchari]WKU16032.1 diphosphate--fructose-6-phosphate 1-phosphotransferase [Candidatus Fervidibacter sacchari]
MPERLGILVGGGPAPGINSVIGAVTIEAINSGLEVIGIYDGFEHLMKGRTDMVRQLTIPDVSRIHFDGGSILRTSRANPTRTAEDLQNTVKALKELGIRYLVTIGGDDTAFSASEVVKAARGAVRVAHVPKTIDNDLPLPGGMPTFGFETARHVGTELVRNLMEDSRTTNRWYFVVAMGRKAGHLALGIGKAAGATITVIGEEFPKERITLAEVCDVLEGAILKRRVLGRKDGVAVIAEGIGEKLDPEELAKIPGVEVERDPHGHIRLGEIPLATILKREIQRRFKERGEKITIVDVTLGYELRCAPPIPFDIDYTRTLGYGAVKFLLSEPKDDKVKEGGMVCLVGGRLEILPFDELRDPVTGRTKVRLVDINSEHYKVAREYMIRLEREDLENPEMLAKLAEAAKMTPEEFKKKFAHVVGLEA